MKLTLAELRKRVGDDEEAAYELLEELRWPTGPICSHCGHDKAYFLTPKDPAGRVSGPHGKRSVRRVWKCAKCRKQFSVLTDTIFQGTKIKLTDWLTVMVLVSSAKNGISGREVERLIGVTPETAWFMLHRLREAMRRESVLAPLSGVVVADETYIGGVERNKHKGDRPAPVSSSGAGPVRVIPGQREKQNRGPKGNKSIVLSLISTETGEARSRVVPDVTGATLRKAIAEQVDMPNTTLHTDEWKGYNAVAQELAGHKTVNHSEDEYVRVEKVRGEDGQVSRNVITSNQAENYFSQLKRSIDGTHHHVSKEHLQRYLDEFDFRYSTRKLSDTARLQRMVDQVDGRRLTYRPLTDHGSVG
ncbi:MAG: putative transposase for insertion sequence element [Acidimicrobiales bacterium]|nr:putative transposase for insertion sequence element [Acidimicrobiales bacterium]